MTWGATSEETEIPAPLQAEDRAQRDRLFEAIAETDEELTLKYLEGETPPCVEELKALLRHATLVGKLVPVFCGQRFAQQGRTALAGWCYRLPPSPQDNAPIRGTVPVTW